MEDIQGLLGILETKFPNSRVLKDFVPYSEFTEGD